MFSSNYIKFLMIKVRMVRTPRLAMGRRRGWVYIRHPSLLELRTRNQVRIVQSHAMPAVQVF